MDLSNENLCKRKYRINQSKECFYRQKKKKYGARPSIAKTQSISSRSIAQKNRAGMIASVIKHENRKSIRDGSLT